MSGARTRASLRALSRWQRPVESRLLGGVCAALSDRTGIHPLLVRLLFMLLSLSQGIGPWLYVALWLLLPSEGERLASSSWSAALGGRLHTAFDELRAGGREAVSALSDARAHGRDRPAGAWPRPLDRFWVGVAIAIVGGVALLASFGLFAWLTPVRALGLAALSLGLGLILSTHLGVKP